MASRSDPTEHATENFVRGMAALMPRPPLPESFAGHRRIRPGIQRSAPGETRVSPGQRGSVPGERRALPGIRCPFPGEQLSSPGEKLILPGKKRVIAHRSGGVVGYQPCGGELRGVAQGFRGCSGGACSFQARERWSTRWRRVFSSFAGLFKALACLFLCAGPGSAPGIWRAALFGPGSGHGICLVATPGPGSGTSKQTNQTSGPGSGPEKR